MLLSNLGLSLGLSGRTDEGIAILRELVRDGAATANTRGNLALVYGLAGREREASAALAADLAPAQIQNNLAYYRELRGLMARGKPVRLAAPAPSSQPAREVATAEAASPQPPATQAATTAPAAARRTAGEPRAEAPRRRLGRSAEPDDGLRPRVGRQAAARQGCRWRRSRSRRRRSGPRIRSDAGAVTSC